MSSQINSPLLALPRELRDNILGFAVEAEEPKCLQLNFRTPPGAFAAIIPSKCSMLLVCRQLRKEYQDALLQNVVTNSSTARDIHTTIWDLHFEPLIDFISGLPSGTVNAFQDKEKLCIDLFFSSPSEATRNDLLKWTDFAIERGIKASYRAPKFVSGDDSLIEHIADQTIRFAHKRKAGPRVNFVDIYDLFSVAGPDPAAEEERVFRCLERWYWFRNVDLSKHRCGNGRRAAINRVWEEVGQRERRNVKSAEDCGRPVRASSPEPSRAVDHDILGIYRSDDE